jgi:SynChlorMet cassette radical SAM/SPASM protein ScmF
MDLQSLYIYLTDACNLQCTHCWQSAPKPGARLAYLPFKSCERVLDDACELGLSSVKLSGGEPLLSPDFPEFVEYFHSRGISCTVETNGTLISGPRLDVIKRCRVQCAVSLDGINPDTHNQQRGHPHAFQNTVRGLRSLEEAQLPFQVIMAVSKTNIHEMIPLLEWFRENWKQCVCIKINPITPNGRAAFMGEQGALLEPLEKMALADEVGTIAGRYPFKVLLHVEPAFAPLGKMRSGAYCGGHCGYQRSLGILADGSVTICSIGKINSEFIFGHVSDIQLADIWKHNPILQQIHEGVEQQLQGVCGMCIFRRSCAGGCRALVLQCGGNLFGPDPICQELYDAGAFPPSRLIPLTNSSSQASHSGNAKETN